MMGFKKKQDQDIISERENTCKFVSVHTLNMLPSRLPAGHQLVDAKVLLLHWNLLMWSLEDTYIIQTLS